MVDASLKRDAENAVTKIQGVREVQNNIEVLPESVADDWIRARLPLSIYMEMSVYLVQEVKQIHIIVKNGNAALEGRLRLKRKRTKRLRWPGTHRACTRWRTISSSEIAALRRQTGMQDS